MKEINITIQSKNGLHVRPGGELVHFIKQFKSDIECSTDSKTVNMKSLFYLQTLGLSQGVKIVVRCQGEDEEIAAKYIQEFFDKLDT